MVFHRYLKGGVSKGEFDALWHLDFRTVTGRRKFGFEGSRNCRTQEQYWTWFGLRFHSEQLCDPAHRTVVHSRGIKL